MLTGVILAGGNDLLINGTPRSLLTFSGEKLVQRQIRIMQEICEEIILVTNNPKLYLPILWNSIRIITDYIPDKGPLSGMHAAFSLSKYTNLWVVGCDMPFISAEAAQRLWEQRLTFDADAVIPKWNNKLFPLHGIYHKRCLDTINYIFDMKIYQTNEMLKRIQFKEADEAFFLQNGLDFDFIQDIHTANDYENALQLDQRQKSIS